MTEWTHHRRAQACIAQSYLTNSKRPESLIKGIFPSHIARGHGCYLFDHQGRKYLDFICGLGTNLLGYGNERVNAAISSELRNGYSHSLATHHELEAAEKLKELFPFVDCVKFLKTGSEACSAAVKIARAKTGRNLVFSAGYHGWADQFVSLTPPATGVGIGSGRDIASFTGDDSELAALPTAAAVIVEPVITDFSRERVEWLKMLREECTAAGTLLIFDEVITGFRFPKFSVSSFFGITPDLIVLGKAIANGMPLAAVGGKYDVMNGAEYFVSSSYAGETLSLTAAKTVMTLLQSKYDLAWLWEKGKAFQDTFNSFWPEKLQIVGYPSRGILAGDAEIKALFMQEAARAGMLFGPSWFFNFPHTEAVDTAMGAIKTIFQRLQAGGVTMDGQPPQSPFAQRVREG
jgi:glutamate-1-semialdehyde 2,1-aminomutase